MILIINWGKDKINYYKWQVRLKFKGENTYNILNEYKLLIIFIILINYLPIHLINLDESLIQLNVILILKVVIVDL